MIDRPNRTIAAQLVRQFRDGEINSDDLESEWPRSDDTALPAIESTVWAYYDDHYPRRMTGKDAATPDEFGALSRYTAFLDTDLPYEWPKSNFYRIGGLGPLKWISFGLLWPLDWWIRRRNARFEAKLRAAGDFDFWPFKRREDFEKVNGAA